MPRTNSALIVFARAPVPGAAKTRLIPRLGAAGAATLHAQLVEHTLRVAQEAGFETLELHGTPDGDAFLHDCARRHGAALTTQAEGDLGARLQAAAESALRDHGHVIVIGTDCPLLGATELRRAGRSLDEGYDAVFIPAEDGGYALIGLARCDERLFAAMPWSTDRVMAESRMRLAALGWRWHELETLWDVDRPEDYDRLLHSGALAESLRGHLGGAGVRRNPHSP